MKMTKFILFIVVVMLGFSGKAQIRNASKDFRFGVGTSMLGTGDMRTIMLENEVNFKLTNYFALAGSLGYGKSDDGVFEQASFIQLNANGYISPCKNNNRNDFRVGTGLSWYAVSDVFRASGTYQDGQLIDADYQFDKRNAVGFNLIIENTYAFTAKYLIGVKALGQFYQNGDTNTGILLKLGVRI